MLHRLLVSTLTVAIASPALAGITFEGSVGQMLIGVGFVDNDASDPFDFTDSALIDNPPVGSYLAMGGWVPGVGTLVSDLKYRERLADRVVFEFENNLNILDFSSSPFEFAAAGNRVTLTSDTLFVVSLRGTLVGTGAAGAAFNVLSDSLAPVIFTPADSPIVFDVVLGPGTYTFGWGAVAAPAGGMSDFAGDISFIAIPAPGTAALLVVAAGMVSARRRR